MNKKIIFSAGGTGGHILPAQNLMRHLSSKGYKVLLVTDSRGANFMNKNSDFKSYILKSGTPTNKNILKKFISLFVIFYSVIKSTYILKKEKPDLVFGFGGYASFPVSLASKIFNLPLFIYENNIILGRSNKILALFSKKIFLAKKISKKLPNKHIKKIYEVGPILDKKIINYLPKKINNEKKLFSILILGGSQGAKIFGEIIPNVISMIKNEGYEIEVMQQCLKDQKNSIIDFYKEKNIKNYVFEFEKDISKLISSSTLAITRSGASSTAELNYTKTPFITIPLPNSIDNHQFLNAKYYENSKCCWLLEQKNFNRKNLFNLIIKNIKDKNSLNNMRKNMGKNNNKNVYEDIENKIKNYLE